MAIDLHFSDRDWARIERDWTAWWEHDLRRPMVVITGEEPPPGRDLPYAPGFLTSLPRNLPVEEVVDRYQAHLEARRYYGDAFPRWWVNFGAGITAAFLGAHVNAVEETVWFSPEAVGDIHALHLSYEGASPWWQRIQAITRCAVERWRGQVTVSFTDLGGNLDILASLRGTQQLLFDLYDAPGEVERLTGEITQLWLRYYREQYALLREGGRGTSAWVPLWAPGSHYVLQSDFSYMLSPAMFERFVLPDLAACCDGIDYPFYHLDGKGEIPHLDMLLSLERLRGIQWIQGDGAPPAEEWLWLLERIRDGGKLCQVFVSAQGARKIVRELGGRGFALVVNDRDYTAEEASDLLKVIAQEDAGR